MNKRISRLSAATQAVMQNDTLASLLKSKRLVKMNGSLDPFSIYACPGLRVAVVLREWQLPKGNWVFLQTINRYRVYAESQTISD